MPRQPPDDYEAARERESERREEYRDEMAAESRRRHRWRCSDHSCGALDCPTCHPENCEDPD